MLLLNLVAMRALWPHVPAILGPTHPRPGHLSTIVFPGEQSQVREGGSCHDPRPTDGGHGNPFSFSGKWAGPAQARGLPAENVGTELHTTHSNCSNGPMRCPFRCRARKEDGFPMPASCLVPTRVSPLHASSALAVRE
jgi:hypothetical protein